MEAKPSRQELNRRRRRSGFVGRNGELSTFRENLARDPDDQAFQYLFHVHGIGGVGKTSLVRRWESTARELAAATVYIDDDVHTVMEAMEAVSTQLGRQGLPMKAFDKLVALYRQRRHEAESVPAQLAPGTLDGQPPAASVSSTVLANAGLAGLNLLPGAAVITGSLDSQQLALGADRLRAALSARFRNHDDVQLVMDPLKVLTPVFLDGLAEAAQHRCWLTLFFDVFERIGPVLDEWLRDLLVTGRYGDLPLNVIAVLSGQGRLNPRHWNDHLDLIASIPLDVFTEQETRQLLASRGVTDEQVIQIILNLSGGMPLQVDLLAQTQPRDPADIGDATGTAVERFLKWTDDPVRRTVAQACAFPLQLDEDIYHAAVPDTAADHYVWLCRQPFVQGHAGRARYHDVVRTAMLRLQRNQSPSEWQIRHTRLADVFAHDRRRLEDGLPSDQYRDNPEWREKRLNEMYHRLCAGPLQALPDALAEIVSACDETPDVLPRWTVVLNQAHHDTDNFSLKEWVTRLSAIPDPATATIATLTALLTAPAEQLTTSVRTLAHTIRGREHRDSGRYDVALVDYTAALALSADFERAYYGRGETHRLMGQNEQALVDFTRALALKPDDAWTHLGRAQTYWAMGESQLALEDLDGVRQGSAEGDPDRIWILRERGHTYRMMRRHEDALVDFTRAIELDPQHAWTFTERGQTYRAMERFGDALTDLNCAIELGPNTVWVLAERGETYRLMERFEDALADFNRAVELDPDYAFGVASRGQTYRAMERFEDALADLNRAIELDPDNAWILGGRGETYRLMERFEDALADFNRAVELDPDYAFGVASRGQTYRAMERFEDALADFTRAIDLSPNPVWNLAQRGQTYRAMERFEDALADFTRATEFDPDNAWAFTERGQTYRAMERFEDALADFTRAVELDPDYAYAVASRGQTYRAMERYEDALADFTRATELDPDAWLLYEAAAVLRLSGRSDELERLVQTAESLFTSASADGTRDVHQLGNLLIFYCVLPDSEKSGRALDHFLDCRPSAARIREALDDLIDLPQAVKDSGLCCTVRGRLENALADCW